MQNNSFYRQNLVTSTNGNMPTQENGEQAGALAISSLCFGIISITLCWNATFGILFGVTGLTISIVSMIIQRVFKMVIFGAVMSSIALITSVSIGVLSLLTAPNTQTSTASAPSSSQTSSPETNASTAPSRHNSGTASPSGTTLYSAANECGIAELSSIHKPSARKSRMPGYTSIYADFTYSSDPTYDQKSDPMEYGISSQARCLLTQLGVSENSLTEVINTDGAGTITNNYLIRSSQSRFDESLFTLDFYELN